MSGLRRPSFFRGSEFPRLVVLVAVVLAGWPMILLFARGGDDPKKPAPPLVSADDLKPVVPDPEVEFSAIVDKVPMLPRESAAYSILLQRTRETPAKTLAAEAHRDLFLTHLYERPAKYRGVPIHIEGTARRVLSHEVNPQLAAKGRIFEAWTYSDETSAAPYVLVFEEPPPGLKIGPELFTRVTFDGYFFKLLGYRAGDANRWAPMLIGRLRSIPAAEPAAPMVELRNMSRTKTFALVFILLFAYIVVRAIFGVGKALRSSRSTRMTGRPPARDDIAPDELSEWLRSVPDEDDDEDAGPPR